MQKVKLLELRDVITAQINLHIPVRLSPKTSLYDLQKARYDFISGRPIKLPVKKGVARCQRESSTKSKILDILDLSGINGGY